MLQPIPNTKSCLTSLLLGAWTLLGARTLLGTCVQFPTKLEPGLNRMISSPFLAATAFNLDRTVSQSLDQAHVISSFKKIHLIILLGAIGRY